MMEHNKLVRDNIPAIVEQNGETAHYHVIEDDETYLLALFEKDFEEAKELMEARNLDELADKLEVLYAIAQTLGFSPEQVEDARRAKFEKRGGFSKRIFLESTE